MAKKVEIAQQFKDKYVPFRLTNVEVFWAHVHTPDTAFGNNRYIIEMHLNDALTQQLIDMGYDIKHKVEKKSGKIEWVSVGEEEKGDKILVRNVFKAKTDAMNKKTGKPNDPPVVVGPDGVTLFTDKIGNGSICNVIVEAKAWQVRGEWKLSAYLKKVQVVKHMAFDSMGFSDVTAEAVPF